MFTIAKDAKVVSTNALADKNSDTTIAKHAITSNIGRRMLSKIFHLDNADNLDLGFSNHLIICISPLYHL